MDDDIIMLRFQSILRDVLGSSDLIVTPTLSARDVEAWDSMKHVELIIAIQEAFGIRFRGREIGNVQNVGEFITLIASKI